MTSGVVSNFSQARTFIRNAGFCLRYGGTEKLPIASMYDAVGGNQIEKAITLTNQLLESHEAVEVTVIASRVCLVHRSLVPSLYKMLRSKKPSPLSREGKAVLELIEAKGEITTKDVRNLFGISSMKTDKDPAYVVLGELQSHLLIDRGPFKITNKAIPYLPKEGYPYHLLQEAHPELVKKSQEISLRDAQRKWIRSYLKSYRQCPPRKMASMFKSFMNPDDVAFHC